MKLLLSEKNSEKEKCILCYHVLFIHHLDVCIYIHMYIYIHLFHVYILGFFEYILLYRLQFITIYQVE